MLLASLRKFRASCFSRHRPIVMCLFVSFVRRTRMHGCEIMKTFRLDPSGCKFQNMQIPIIRRRLSDTLLLFYSSGLHCNHVYLLRVACAELSRLRELAGSKFRTLAGNSSPGVDGDSKRRVRDESRKNVPIFWGKRRANNARITLQNVAELPS